MNNNKDCSLYWNETAEEYQDVTRISTDDFHYGPLLPGEKTVKLLPKIVKGMKCLEIGSGAAQNSFYLASLGAECLATDISSEQLRHGEKIGKDLGLEVTLKVAGLDEINEKDFGKFDLIHSTWALPFAEDQKSVVENCAAMLNPGGHIVFTTGHPVFAGEWIELDDFEKGMFVTDYFNPPGEVRFTKDETKFVRTQQYPISTYVQWILESGLTLVNLVEHKPIELETLSVEEVENIVPYDSEIWRDMYEQIKKVPFVVTYIATKK